MRDADTIRDQLQHALSSLERTRTSAQIAESLRLLGVRGRQMKSASCPVSVYLQRMMPEYDHTVGAESVDSYCFPSATEKMVGVTLPMPPGVRQFVRDFDHGDYPFLIEGRAQ